MKISEKIPQVVKDRVSQKTTGSTAAKIRDVAGVAFIILSLTAAAPLSLPVAAIAWINWGVLVTGAISGGSSLNKSKKTK